MALTQLQVVNRALTEIARGNPLASGDVSTNFDGTANGIYAATLYQGAVEMLLRQQDFEFSRGGIVLTPVVIAVPLQWSTAYLYPTDCLRVRQIVPDTWDDNDPHPVTWDVGTFGISSVQTRLILTNEANARIIYTTNAVTESEWDAGFTEEMVRYLGSQLALPVAGRPDFSREMLRIAGGMGQSNMDRDS